MIIGTGIDIVEINRFKKIKDLKVKTKLYFLQKNLRLKRHLLKRLELALESLIT